MTQHSVFSPLPGTFYRKSAPDAAPYVSEGDSVSTHSVIGLIEVMKQFSEVYAEADGVVQGFHVEDGDPVEPGQLLLTIEHR